MTPTPKANAALAGLRIILKKLGRKL